MLETIYIGYDPRQEMAYRVARGSIRRRLSRPIPVHPLVLAELRRAGIYRRPTERRARPDRPGSHRSITSVGAPDDPGRSKDPNRRDDLGWVLWDAISDAPMATEFACARFLVKSLAGGGWVLFVDDDVMARADLAALFALADPRFAVMCVQHDHVPTETVKMDGQAQTRYARKNWSSVMLVNCDHPANRALTGELVNTVPGRDLHRFCWLEDAEIGALPLEWNWLAGVSPPCADPKLVHFTNGTPDVPGYENAPFADEWREELSLCAPVARAATSGAHSAPAPNGDPGTLSAPGADALRAGA